MEVQDRDGKSRAGAQFIAPIVRYPPGASLPYEKGIRGRHADNQTVGYPPGAPLPYTKRPTMPVYSRSAPGGYPEPLYLDAPTFRTLMQLQGPSLGLWRAAEIAALREQVFEPPVLDLGCGDGLVTSKVLSKVEVGLDPDSRVLERAAQYGIYERFEAAPAERMQLPDGSIGTVLSNSVLEHLPQLGMVLAAIVRVLRPGGRLIFTVPTEAFSNWLVLPFTRYAAWRNRQLCHLNLWTTECWKEHLHRVGLEVEQVRTYLGHRWVSLWDALELSQQIWIARKRLFGIIWRRIPPTLMDRLALRVAHLNLAAPAPGGGRLIVARKL